MLIRQNVWRTALFHRPALVEHINFFEKEAKSRKIAGLSDAIRHFETTSNFLPLKQHQFRMGKHQRFSIGQAPGFSRILAHVALVSLVSLICAVTLSAPTPHTTP
jgi:hypothetical protein